MMVNTRLLPLFHLLWILGGGLATLPVAAFQVTDPAEITQLQQLVANDRLKEADRQITDLLSHEPDNPDLQFMQALIADKSGNVDKAMGLYQQLIQSRPGMLEPYNNLALLQAHRGHYQAAIDTLEQAIQSDPKLAALYDNLTALFTRLASEAYREALNSDTPAPPLGLTRFDQPEGESCGCTTSYSESVVKSTEEQADQPENQPGVSIGENKGVTNTSRSKKELSDPLD